MTLREIAEFMLKNDKVAVWLGVRLIDIKEGYAFIEMEVQNKMLNAAGICQGGAIFSFADFAFALASNSYGKVALATSASISFLNPALEGEILTAEAVEKNRTRRTGVYQVEVKKKDGTPVALFMGNVFVKDRTF